ncbi:MAG: caspase family protein [Capsulimonadaceae bacterium]|nr:caspase family protein [Capsulimonadaceae bacterium]
MAITYMVHTLSGNVPKDVHVFVDDAPVAYTNIQNRRIIFVGQDSSKVTISVKVPRKDCKVSIVATDENGQSEPAVIALVWKGESPQPAIAEQPAKPGAGVQVARMLPVTPQRTHPRMPAQPPHGSLYVLAIGVANYKDANLALTYPAKDASDFANAATKQQGLRYATVTTRVLTDEQASKDNVEDALEWMKTVVKPDDVAMILISGHGFNDPDGDYRYAPWNMDTANYRHTSVKFSDIRDSLSKIQGKVVLFLDTCHSGNLMESGKNRGRIDINRLVNEFTSAEYGIVVFAASQGNQTAEENDDVRNGVFTKAVVEGLSGQADPYGSGEVKILGLGAFISDEVQRLTQGRQNPTFTLPTTTTNFDIAYVAQS